jgi:hypothetical protein
MRAEQMPKLRGRSIHRQAYEDRDRPRARGLESLRPRPEEFNGFGNLLNSHLVYVADFYRSEV